MRDRLNVVVLRLAPIVALYSLAIAGVVLHWFQTPVYMIQVMIINPFVALLLFPIDKRWSLAEKVLFSAALTFSAIIVIDLLSAVVLGKLDPAIVADLLTSLIIVIIGVELVPIWRQHLQTS